MPLFSCAQPKDPFLSKLSCPPREKVDSLALLENLPEIPSWPDWVRFNGERQSVLPGPIVCHGYHHGYLVVSDYNSAWWTHSFYILGNAYFFGGESSAYTNTICFEVEEGEPIAYDEIRSANHRPLKDLYCEGVFADEEVYRFALEDLAAKSEGLRGEDLKAWKTETAQLLDSAYEGYDIPNYRNKDLLKAIEPIPYSLDLPKEVTDSWGSFRTIVRGKETVASDGRSVIRSYEFVDLPAAEEISSMLWCGESEGFGLLTSIAPKTRELSSTQKPLERDYYPFNGASIEGQRPSGWGSEDNYEPTYRRLSWPFNYSRSFNREFYFGDRGYPIYAFKNGVFYEAAALYLAGSLPKSAFAMVARALYSYDLDHSKDKEAFAKSYIEKWNENYKDGGQVYIVS